MKQLLLLSLLISNYSFAQKISGEPLKHQDFNSSVFNLGDIKQSLLPIDKFQLLNGDCWVKMSGQNISTSDYGILTGQTLLPNTQGKFLRDVGGSAAALGQPQDDAFQGHKVGLLAITSVGSGDAYALTAGSAISSRGTGNTIVTDQVRGFYTDGSNGNPRVASETRPTNVSVNYFIKINKVCNFN